jgi:hypothetical protein
MGDTSPPSERDASLEGLGTDGAREPDVKALLSSGLATSCYYAERPTDRPDCARLGVVRYGPITLCWECDRRRSAVGKAMSPVHLPDPAGLLEVLAAEQACLVGDRSDPRHHPSSRPATLRRQPARSAGPRELASQAAARRWPETSTCP